MKKQNVTPPFQTNHSLKTSRPNLRSHELATDFSSRFLEKSNSEKHLELYVRFQVRYRYAVNIGRILISTYKGRQKEFLPSALSTSLVLLGRACRHSLLCSFLHQFLF